MNATRAFALIKTELERLDPALQGNEIDDDYRAGVVLLAAVWVTGADIEELATFTGYDPDFFSRDISQNAQVRSLGRKWPRAFGPLVSRRLLLQRSLLV
jgi:hypothetical protein